MSQEQYPSLYNIVRKRRDKIANVLSTVLNVSLRRTLVSHNHVLWHDLVRRIAHINLTEEADVFRCKLHQNGVFLCSLQVYGVD
jgi:hypothetical protein